METYIVYRMKDKRNGWQIYACVREGFGSFEKSVEWMVGNAPNNPDYFIARHIVERGGENLVFDEIVRLPQEQAFKVSKNLNALDTKSSGAVYRPQTTNSTSAQVDQTDLVKQIKNLQYRVLALESKSEQPKRQVTSSNGVKGGENVRNEETQP